MKPIRILVLLTLILLLAGCHVGKVYKIKYLNSTIGISNTAVRDFVELPPGMESQTFGDKFIKALKQMNFGIPKLNVKDTLQDGTTYSTDRVTLTQNEIDNYNNKCGKNGATKLLLSNGPVYGIYYSFSYNVRKGRKIITLQMQSNIQVHGSGSVVWGDYKGEYDGIYFVDILKDKLVKTLTNSR